MSVWLSYRAGPGIGLGGGAELVVPPVVAKRLAALPVVAEFCRRLDIAGIIDRLCPVRDVARLSHGEVIEALAADRLTAPAPLQHIAARADEWAVEEVFGIEEEALNDDRIARALDAIARNWTPSRARSGPPRSPLSAWTSPARTGT